MCDQQSSFPSASRSAKAFRQREELDPVKGGHIREALLREQKPRLLEKAKLINRIVNEGHTGCGHEPPFGQGILLAARHALEHLAFQLLELSEE